MVVSVKPGGGGYTVYTLTFTQTQAGFDRSWEEGFVPILESVGVDRGAE